MSSSTTTAALVRTDSLPAVRPDEPDTVRTYHLACDRESLEAYLRWCGIQPRTRPSVGRLMLHGPGWRAGVFYEPTDDGFVVWYADRYRWVLPRALEVRIDAREDHLRVTASLASVGNELTRHVAAQMPGWWLLPVTFWSLGSGAWLVAAGIVAASLGFTVYAHRWLQRSRAVQARFHQLLAPHDLGHGGETYRALTTAR